MNFNERRCFDRYKIVYIFYYREIRLFSVLGEFPAVKQARATRSHPKRRGWCTICANLKKGGQGLMLLLSRGVSSGLRRSRPYHTICVPLTSRYSPAIQFGLRNSRHQTKWSRPSGETIRLPQVLRHWQIPQNLGSAYSSKRFTAASPYCSSASGLEAMSVLRERSTSEVIGIETWAPARVTEMAATASAQAS